MKQFTDVLELISFIETSKRFSPKVGLEKMNYLCELFDHPEQKFTSIHVTGTNGKGSVVSYLASIFRQAGLKVATFTSPYITCFNERIQSDGNMISNEDVLRIGNYILSKYDAISEAGYDAPTFFELVTLIAFIYFSEQTDLDLAIIEVGIGGRLDSTNVITPIISVITGVSFDHMNVLGNSLPEILTQKLGIVKPNVPLVSAVQDPDLQQLCLEVCAKNQSQCFFTSPLSVEKKVVTLFGNRFELSNCGIIETALTGFHQIENALVAIKTIEVFNQGLFNKMKTSKNPISDVILRRGLKETRWPGRLEVVSKQPLVVIDGAHNVDGIKRIAEFVQSLPYQTKRCIFACSDDKDKEHMIHQLESLFDEIVFTVFTYKRHSDALYLYEVSNHPNKKLDLDIPHAIDYVWNSPLELNLFIGSLYFVSEVRPLLIQKMKSN